MYYETFIHHQRPIVKHYLLVDLGCGAISKFIAKNHYQNSFYAKDKQ